VFFEIPRDFPSLSLFLLIDTSQISTFSLPFSSPARVSPPDLLVLGTFRATTHFLSLCPVPFALFLDSISFRSPFKKAFLSLPGVFPFFPRSPGRSPAVLVQPPSSPTVNSAAQPPFPTKGYPLVCPVVGGFASSPPPYPLLFHQRQSRNHQIPYFLGETPLE